jgi:glucokinase
MTEDVLVCVDAGGTNIRVGVFDLGGTLVERHKEPTRSGPHAGDPLLHIERLIHQVTHSGRAIRAAAVGVPALVDRETGTTSDCPNVPELAHRTLEAELRSRLGVDVTVVNDSNLAALGEYHVGAGRGHSNVLSLTIGTGIGCGLVVDDRLVWGSRGFAGEIGDWLVVDQEHPDKGLPVRLESVASGLALVAAARRSFELSGDTAAANEISGASLARAANDGDPRATVLFERMGYHLGTALANMAMLLNPGIVVIGGGVAKAGRVFRDPVVASFRSTVTRSIGDDVEIVLSTLLDDAAMFGGVALLRRHAAAPRPQEPA